MTLLGVIHPGPCVRINSQLPPHLQARVSPLEIPRLLWETARRLLPLTLSTWLILSPLSVSEGREKGEVVGAGPQWRWINNRSLLRFSRLDHGGRSKYPFFFCLLCCFLPQARSAEGPERLEEPTEDGIIGAECPRSVCFAYFFWFLQMAQDASGYLRR